MGWSIAKPVRPSPSSAGRPRRAAQRLYGVVARWTMGGLAVVALVGLSPLLGLIAVAIALQIGRPVLFTQERLGLGGRPFRLYKFRTMRPQPVGAAWDPSTDADRLTSVGRLLRRWSLDELPQLWNIARGDMALIGPRPLPSVYGERYHPVEQERHTVRPGLTGLAQVRGRNTLGWSERLAADVEYARTWGVGADLRIVWATIGVVLGGRGVSSGAEVTMQELPPAAARPLSARFADPAFPPAM